MTLASRLARQLRDFLLRWPVPAALLFRMWLDITSRCSKLACSSCPQRPLGECQRQDMPEALLEGLAGQAGALGCQVNLFHRGEPLLRPDLGHLIARFRQGGARLLRLHSNATLLDQARVGGSDGQSPTARVNLERLRGLGLERAIRRQPHN